MGYSYAISRAALLSLFLFNYIYIPTVNDLNKQVYYFSRHPWMTVRNIKKREECLKVGRVELSAAAAASFDGLDTQCQNN